LGSELDRQKTGELCGIPECKRRYLPSLSKREREEDGDLNNELKNSLTLQLRGRKEEELEKEERHSARDKRDSGDTS